MKMQEKVFYTYLHVRPDTNTVFYVGVGSDYPGSYSRAYEFGQGKRNQLWCKIWNKNKRKVNVIVKTVHQNLEECFEEEMFLIEFYGRLCDKTGSLANISKGGDHKAGEPKQVVQYDIQGNFLKVWQSAMLASHVYDVCNKSVYASISKKRPCAGFFWTWFENTEPEAHIKRTLKTRNAKKVYAFDKNCNCVGDFRSVRNAAKTTLVSAASIFKTITGKRKSAGGYYWSYSKNCTSLTKELLVQYDLNNNFIHVHNNVAQAAKTLNLKSTTAIRNCLKGFQKQAYGYVWKMEQAAQTKEMLLSENRL